MLNLEHFLTARAELRRRASSRRADRLGRPIKGPEFDDAVMIDVPDLPPAPPLAFHIVYRSGAGQLSGRCITLRSLREELDEVRLAAFCHMRNGMRSFYGSRVEEATDLATGEIHDDGLAFFKSHPLLKPPTADSLAGLSSEILAVHECRDEIIILSFIGAADGEFDEAEFDQIVQHVHNRSDENLSDTEIRRRVAAFVPDERAFHRALDRICNGGGDAKALMRSMRRVMDADGELDDEEFAFALEVQNRLQASGRI